VGEVVEDVDAAVAFYESLGVTVRRDAESTEYAVIEVPGVLHFGLWSRAAAAESTFGSRDAAARVPLGFQVAFEVDSVDETAGELGATTLRGAQDEPWGQRTLRFRSPSGAMSEIAETPWARELESNATPKASEAAASELS
jgi:catechol 2,3-dioxygenase-like lactoylglutathione lyase family enzyme